MFTSASTHTFFLFFFRMSGLDCYRHYESLAFGAIPVTQLNPKYYWHFDGGPIIYNNTEWRNRTPNNFLNQLGVDEFPGMLVPV